MNRVVLIIFVLFLSSCSIKGKEDIMINDEFYEDTIVDKEEYIDDNQIKLGLFLRDNNYNNKERLEDTYYTEFVSGEDIGLFEVFLTDDKMVDGTSFKNLWDKYYKEYDDIDDYKIGFNIKFILEDGTNYNGNFLAPDIYKFSDYFFVYLYDDVHQNNDTYGHLENMNEDTLLTSVKISARDGIDKVENLILSVFSYDSEDDFDEEGNYIGNSIYVIRIKRK